MTSAVQYTAVSWRRCISRCHNPDDPDYARYGARGIVVCQEWRDSFQQFMLDMGLRPHGMTLDRIESKGNYEPTNCRWATSQEQNRHARHLLTYRGEEKTVGEWAAQFGMNVTTLSMRLKRMSVEEALETPVQK